MTPVLLTLLPYLMIPVGFGFLIKGADLLVEGASAVARRFNVSNMVVGSNIFNILFILGISAVIQPLPLRDGSNIDMGTTLGATLLLFIFMFTGRSHALDRWEGLLCVSLYSGYVGVLLFQVW